MKVSYNIWTSRLYKTLFLTNYMKAHIGLQFKCNITSASYFTHNAQEAAQATICHKNHPAFRVAEEHLFPAQAPLVNIH